MGVFMVGRMAWVGRGWLGFGAAGAGGAWCRRLVLWCCFQGCSSKRGVTSSFTMLLLGNTHGFLANKI